MREYLGRKFKNKKVIRLVLILLIILVSICLTFDFVKMKKINVSYKENSTVKYVLYSTDGTSFKDNVSSYKSDMTDNIKINFSYEKSFVRKVKYQGVYYLKARISVIDKDLKVIYEDSNRITDKVEFSSYDDSISITKNALINYKEYFKYGEVFRNNFGALNDVLLEVIFCVDDWDLATIKIPLNEGFISTSLDDTFREGKINSYSRYVFGFFDGCLLFLDIFLIIGFIISKKEKIDII